MIATELSTAQPVALATDDALWSRALDRTHEVLSLAAKGMVEPGSAAFTVAACAARADDQRGPELVSLMRRALVRGSWSSDTLLRCLRSLARAGGPVDIPRLVQFTRAAGRAPRIAAAALGEAAARGEQSATGALIDALETPVRADAALFLSYLCTQESLNALARRLRTPGPAGVTAAGALVAAEDDPFAFEVLCERLCEPSVAVLAAQALWGAAPDGKRLLEAESALSRWSRRGIALAEHGRLVAGAMLTAGGITQDVTATYRAAASDEEELALVGARAAFALGDAERARTTAMDLLRRGPTYASRSFQLLVSWAELGDDRSLALVRSTLERRPVDLARSSVFEALAGTTRRGLCGVVARAVGATDRLTALEGARALARLREPPSIVPGLWM